MEELICLEEGYSLRRAAEDRVILGDDRVLSNLLATEDRYHPSLAYFKYQKEIMPYMRKVVVTWMLEVCEEQKREDEVFPLSINFLDRVLSSIQVKKGRLQLVATACLFVASKMKETCPLDAHRLVMYTDYSITAAELIDWELLVLQVLRWDTCAVTAHDFLHPLLVRLPGVPAHKHQDVLRHSATFVAMCAIDFNLAALPPSIVAASSLVASIKGLVPDLTSSNQQSRLIDLLHRITAIDTEYIKSCVNQIELALTNNFLQSVDESASSHSATLTPSTPNQKPLEIGLPSTPTDVREIIVVT